MLTDPSRLTHNKTFLTFQIFTHSSLRLHLHARQVRTSCVPLALCNAHTMYNSVMTEPKRVALYVVNWDLIMRSRVPVNHDPKVMEILISGTLGGPSRGVKQEQEEFPRNHTQTMYIMRDVLIGTTLLMLTPRRAKSFL